MLGHAKNVHGRDWWYAGAIDMLGEVVSPSRAATAS